MLVTDKTKKEVTMKENEKLTKELEEVNKNKEKDPNNTKNGISHLDWDRMREEFFTEKKTIVEIVIELSARDQAASSALRSATYLADIHPSAPLMLMAGIYMGDLKKIYNINEFDIFTVAEILYFSFDKDELYELENLARSTARADAEFKKENKKGE